MDALLIEEYMQQGSVLVGQGMYEEAMAYYEKAEQENPMNVDIYIAKGIALANMNLLTDAKVEFEKALIIDKEMGLVHFHLGSVAIMEGDLSEGLSYYNKAIAFGYDDAQLYYSLGLLHEENGEYEIAIRQYSKAIKKNPYRPDMHMRKAQLLIKVSQLPEAVQALDEAILHNPDVFDGYHLKFSLLLEMQQYDIAETFLDNVIEQFPDDQRFKMDRVKLLMLLDRAEEAEKNLMAIESDPTTEDDVRRSVYMTLAQMHATDGNLEEAIAVLDKAVDISEKYEMYDEEVKFLLMNCYLGLEKFEEVLTVSRDLIEHAQYSEHQNSARYFEPMALKMLGKEEEAIPLYEQAINDLRSQSLDRPGEMDLYLLRIMCLRDIKAYEKAMELLDYVMTLLPDRMEPKVVKVSLLEAMGHTEEAKKLGEEVRAAMPEAFVGV